MSTLVAENIGLTFAKQEIPTLENINLSLSEGSLTVVLGESGCGKTTLLNILAGFQKPTIGHISLDKKILHEPDETRAVVFQEHALFPWLNVEENISFSLDIKKEKEQIIEQKVAEILQIVGLSHVAKSNIWELSGGMKQRVGIARALISHANFILLDEPFAALDAFTRENMQKLVLDLWSKRNKSFFLITHDIEEALLLSEELIIMQAKPGRIAKRLQLDFSHRYRNRENIRSIKSDPQFIELREQLFSQLSHEVESQI
ncbi:ATP-binding cassette domain-containing protein [Acinetobacter nectaris]|uniref:ATP-binding cassette domain-containing protein n=1 Tax=Acinetobacter nectaris TaxID=1219382 RepID=UPI001F008EC8|nr:ATP-binding cassette domain-containing protein [Acinetobacter nectaris]MCF8999991.1 ATP-binding cassette domain-containing protein [Acinetobacter nectaris]MCF9028372.1 ATP-binding cassette domain-containing protein [Acinetobacter nectaris]